MGHDMTKGSVFKILLSFTIPLILSGLLQQLYYIVDSVIIGNLLGEVALAAVGVSSPIINIFIYIITGLVSGYTILISQFFGAKDPKKISKLSSTFFLFVTIAACIITTVGFISKESILHLLHTPTELILPSLEYMTGIFLGIPFLIIYNLYSSLLRGIGDSKTPLYSIILSTVINIILDLAFIKLFAWGIKGVAIATCIAQIFSCCYLAVNLYRKYPMYKISVKKTYMDLPLFYESLKLSFPSMIQTSIGVFGSLLLQNIMNSLGIDVVTAITTAYKIDTLTILPLINISIAISVFVGQNAGADDIERSKEGLKKGIIISIVVSLAITTIVVVGGEHFMKIFGVSDKVAAMGQRFFNICAIFYPIYGIGNAYSAFLQGNKDVTFIAINNVLSLAVRVALSYLLVKKLGFDIIAISEMSSWVLGAVISYARNRATYGKAVAI